MSEIDLRFRLADDIGGLGLSCTVDGLSLAGARLLRKTIAGFTPRPVDELGALVKGAYGAEVAAADLWRGLDVVARALNSGDLGRAMIAAVQLRLPELSWEAAARLAQAEDALAKYDENEPRDWHGRWTTGAGGGAPPAPGANADNSSGADDSSSALFIDVAYRGVYHDKVVAQLAAALRAAGANVVTSVRLVAVDRSSAIADLLFIPPSGEPMVLVEIKTGNDPKYTDPQMDIYPLAELGGHVSSPDAKIALLGYLPNMPLPPMLVFTYYKKDEASPYEKVPNAKPMIRRFRHRLRT